MEESEQQRKLSYVLCSTFEGLGTLIICGLDNRVVVEMGVHQWQTSFTFQFYPAYFNATENHGKGCFFDTYVIHC